MNRRNSNMFVGIIVALGAVGLVYTLFTNPSRVFTQLGMIVLTVGVIFLIYKWYMRRRNGGREQTAFLRAAKRSKRRFNEKKSYKPSISRIDIKKGSSSPKKTFTTVQKKKSSANLTVIEGKKGKKKNRAFF